MTAKPTLADTLTRFKLERCRNQLQAALTTPAVHTQWARFKAEVNKAAYPHGPSPKRISTYDSLHSLRSSAISLHSPKRTLSSSDSLYPSYPRKSTFNLTSTLNTTLLRSTKTDSSYVEKRLLVEVMPLDVVLRSNEALEKIGEERCLPRRYAEEMHKLARLIQGKL